MKDLHLETGLTADGNHIIVGNDAGIALFVYTYLKQPKNLMDFLFCYSLKDLRFMRDQLSEIKANASA